MVFGIEFGGFFWVFVDGSWLVFVGGPLALLMSCDAGTAAGFMPRKLEKHPGNGVIKCKCECEPLAKLYAPSKNTKKKALLGIFLGLSTSFIHFYFNE